MWKRLKLILKWLARCLGVLMAVLILFIVEENIRGKIALHSYLRQLHQQGEKLKPVELGFSKTSPPSAVLEELIAAGKELETLKQDSSFNIGWQLAFRGVMIDQSGRIRKVPGEAMVRHQRADLGVPLSRRPGPRRMAGWDDLAGEVARTSNVLARVKAALAKPGLAVHLDWSNCRTTDLSHLDAVDAVSVWLAIEALGDLHRQELDAAIRDIDTLATLTRFLKDEPLLNSQFVRQKVARVGMYMTWETLQAPGVTDEQLAALESVWESCNFTDGLIAHLEGERACRLAYFERVRRSPKTFWEECKGQMSDHISDEYSFDQFLFDAAQMPRVFLWRVAWFDQDELEFLKEWQVCLDQAREALAYGDRTRFTFNGSTSSWRRNRYSYWWFLMAQQLAPDDEMLVLTPMRVETERRMTVAAIALKRYQLAHGVLPDSLTDLTPRFLADVPRDFMNGQPLRYRRNKDDTFLLYSTGQNSVDDGGSLERDLAHLPNSWLWMTCDAVWPRPTFREPPPPPVPQDSGGLRRRGE